jgi:4-amino-4-deoxy-L-arabinose transferase-like glycosyltransferase
MAYWPKTLRGTIFALFAIVLGIPLAVIVAIAMSGPLVWAGLALAALISVALYIWRRTINDARERAWVGEFSFGDVIASRRDRETLDHPAR